MRYQVDLIWVSMGLLRAFMDLFPSEFKDFGVDARTDNHSIRNLSSCLKHLGPAGRHVDGNLPLRAESQLGVSKGKPYTLIVNGLTGHQTPKHSNGVPTNLYSGRPIAHLCNKCFTYTQTQDSSAP